jgi:WD40 repeat protein
MASSTGYIATYNRDNCEVTVRDAGIGAGFASVIMPPIDLTSDDFPCYGVPIVCFSRDNSQLACATSHLSRRDELSIGFSIYLQIIDISNGLLLKKIRNNFFCVALSFTVDASRLVVQDDKGKMALIDTRSENILGAWTATAVFESLKIPMQLSYDGLVIASCDGPALVLWAADTCQEIARLTGAGHAANIRCVCGGRGSNTTATSDVQGVVIFWDVGLRSQEGQLILEGVVASASFSDQGNLFVCHTPDPACVYVIATGTYEVIAKRRFDAIADVCFLPSSTHIACRALGITVWDKWTNKLLDVEALLQGAGDGLGEWTLENKDCFVCSSFPPQTILM